MKSYNSISEVLSDLSIPSNCTFNVDSNDGGFIHFKTKEIYTDGVSFNGWIHSIANTNLGYRFEIELAYHNFKLGSNIVNKEFFDNYVIEITSYLEN